MAAGLRHRGSKVNDNTSLFFKIRFAPNLFKPLGLFQELVNSQALRFVDNEETLVE